VCLVLGNGRFRPEAEVREFVPHAAKRTLTCSALVLLSRSDCPEHRSR
jgi:hypothetical protein